MTIKEFKCRMLLSALSAGKALCEYVCDEGIEKEPEQVRRNVATILTLLTETEEFLKSILPKKNKCLGSD